MLAILIPIVFVGLWVLSEYLMARNSKWDVLSKKFGNSVNPPNGWRGCRFVQMEILEGNILKRTTYGHGFSRSATDMIWAKAFPNVLVSTGPAGLYLKRQPWNFMHKQVLIPWGRFSSVQTISGTQHATESVNRQFRGNPMQIKLPNAVASVLDKLAGDVVELKVADPSVRISMTAEAVGNWEQYAAKPKAPVLQPGSPVGVA